MTFATDKTREAIENLAIARYPYGAEDEHGYRSLDEKVFALLVDVAAAYTDIMNDGAVGRFAAGLDGERAERTLGDMAGGPVEVTVQGLRENLEMLADGSAEPV